MKIPSCASVLCKRLQCIFKHWSRVPLSKGNAAKWCRASQMACWSSSCERILWLNPWASTTTSSVEAQHAWPPGLVERSRSLPMRTAPQPPSNPGTGGMVGWGLGAQIAV